MCVRETLVELLYLHEPTVFYKWVYSFLVHRVIQRTKCDDSCKNTLKTGKHYTHKRGLGYWFFESLHRDVQQALSRVKAHSLVVVSREKQIELTGGLKFSCTLNCSYLARDTLHMNKEENHTFFQVMLVSIRIRCRLQACLEEGKLNLCWISLQTFWAIIASPLQQVYGKGLCSCLRQTLGGLWDHEYVYWCVLDRVGSQ